MEEELFEAVDDSGNDVWIISLKPTAERMSLNGDRGRAAESETRYFLNSLTGVELFREGDGTLKAKGGEKEYRVR